MAGDEDDIREAFRRVSNVERQLAEHVAECNVIRAQHAKERREDLERSARDKDELLDAFGQLKESMATKEKKQDVKLDTLLAESWKRKGAWGFVIGLSVIIGICAGIGALAGTMLGK